MNKKLLLVGAGIVGFTLLTSKPTTDEAISLGGSGGHIGKPSSYVSPTSDQPKNVFNFPSPQPITIDDSAETTPTITKKTADTNTGTPVKADTNTGTPVNLGIYGNFSYLPASKGGLGVGYVTTNKAGELVGTEATKISQTTAQKIGMQPITKKTAEVTNPLIKNKWWY